MHTIVVKVGTNALTHGGKTLSRRFMLELVKQIAELLESGRHIILVSSGAVAGGRDLIDSSSKQILSSIGQVKLMQIWSELFSFYDLKVGQVLLTKTDFLMPSTKNTIMGLLGNGIIPIVNENDTVATHETSVGDNDNLAALVAQMINADAVILLTDQEGLFTADPRLDPQATLIPVVSKIDASILQLAQGSSTSVGTGGMLTKIQAAQKSGTKTIIASAHRPNVLIDIAKGEQIGTVFMEEK